ncbi:stage III sporulation protein AF [Selenihalanaerobacter shriftii]|uniref:Stage III sporulation protein AF n=1 Tax=Selenihalanaerobacter shriftii TaxID=142842 RepID=A0A1T4P2L5_9FIRM|nr:stage III sporulation protein AF [Selenihalanaerobacter shriftii]SJZ85764.1 stage III sporulation protein AF [Selenihalanaerobacter shriftii]
MITYLEVWIKNLVLIMILTSFVELLLPKNKLEKYIRVVLGLFIVIAILNPILNLFSGNYDLREITDLLTVPKNNTGQMASIMQRGQELKNNNQSKARSNYKKQLAKQINALLSFDDNLPQTSIVVNLQANNQIENIIVKLTGKKISNNFSQIKPIEVSNVGDENQEKIEDKREYSQAKVSKQIKERLADFYGLSINQILIQAE